MGHTDDIEPVNPPTETLAEYACGCRVQVEDHGRSVYRWVPCAMHQAAGALLDVCKSIPELVRVCEALGYEGDYRDEHVAGLRESKAAILSKATAALVLAKPKVKED